MALTVTQTKRNNVTGTKVTAYVTVAFDNSYPTGGEEFDATAYVKTPDEVRVTNDSALGYIVRYDATNKKLKVFAQATTDDQSSVVAAGVTAALVEAKNATDLTSPQLTVDLVISGGRA